MGSRFFGGLGRFAVRYRFAVLAGWVVVVAGSVLFLPSIGSAINANDAALLPQGAPSMRALALARPIGSENFSTVLIVVHRDGGALGSGDQRAVVAVSAAVRRVPQVQEVTDAGSSADGEAHLLVVQSNVSLFSSANTATLVGRLDRAAASVTAPAGLHVDVAGEIADTIAAQAANQHRATELEDVSTLLILFLLLIVFRSVLAPLLIFVPAAVAVLVSQRVVAELPGAGIQISDLTQVLLIALVLGAGTDYGLFLGLRVREEMRRGAEFSDAMVIGMRRVGESIAFSAFTVILALLCLLLATFGMYQSLGVPLAVAVGVMLVAGLTLTPALLAAVGPRMFWPSRVRASGADGASNARPAESGGVWYRIARLAAYRPVATLCVGLVVFGALAAVSAWSKPAGTEGALSAPAGSSAARGDAAFAAHWPGQSESPTVIVIRLRHSVWSDPGQLSTFAGTLSHSSLFHAVLGPLDPVGLPIAPSLLTDFWNLVGPPQRLPVIKPSDFSVLPLSYAEYRTTSQYISPDGMTVQFAVTLAGGAPLSTGALREIPAVRHLVSEAARGTGVVAAGVTGQTAGVFDVSEVSGNDFWRVVPAVVIVIALLLGLMLRSLVAPLYLVASVTLSLFATLGVAVILFMGIGHQGGVFFILPFILFIFLLALGEDYNILLMSRIRDEHHRGSLREAIARALASTGSTISSAGLVMAGTFGVLAFSGDPGSSNAEVRQVGTVLAIGILLDTFLVRTLLVPSVVALLGRWNWWPSKMSERFVGRFERYSYHLSDLASTHPAGSALRGVLPGPALILTASLGAGHDGVAGELSRRLEGAGYDTVTMDFCEILPWKLGTLIRSTFEFSVKRLPRLYDFIFSHWLLPVKPARSPFSPIGKLVERHLARWAAANRPSVVVSTFNICTQAVGALRDRGELEAPTASVVVDFYPHGAWSHPGVDLNLCLHDAAASIIRSLPCREVRTTGPTVRPVYLDPPWDRDVVRRGLGVKDADRLVLVVGGSWGVGEVVHTVRDICRCPGLVPLVVCGRNQKLQKAVEQVVEPAGKGVVFGWVGDMSPLMVASDAMLENAGGLTCMEALAIGLPVVSYRPIPGHGRVNVEAMARAGVVRYARSVEELRRELEVITTSARERMQMSRAVATMFEEGDSASAIIRLAGGGIGRRIPVAETLMEPSFEGFARSLVS